MSKLLLLWCLLVLGAVSAEIPSNGAGVPTPLTDGSDVLANVITSTSSGAPRCPPDWYGFIAHPDQCNLFYVCWAGTPIPTFCNKGYEFEPIRSTCIRIAPGGCTLGGYATTDIPSTPGPTTTKGYEFTTNSPSESPRCPPGFVGNISHPETCRAYFRCNMWGEATFAICSPGFEFDSARGTCVPIAPGGCILGTTVATDIPSTPGPTTTEGEGYEYTTMPPTASPICPPGFVGNIPHPQMCNAYYRCTTSGTAIIMHCPNGFEYEPVVEGCIWIVPGGCTIGNVTTITSTPEPTMPTITSSAPTSSFCAAGFLGPVPHPDKCDSFYMCLGSAAIQMYCTTGSEFDAQQRTCVPINPGGCTLGTGIVTTTTEHMTTGSS